MILKKQLRINIYLVLLFFSLPIVKAAYFPIPEVSVGKKSFENILLIINFNHPHYGNIEFLKKLYAPFFEKIVFYGEHQHPEVTAIKTESGFYISDVLLHALENNPNFSGYLFLEDDCILNIWNLFLLDFNKIWLLPGFSKSPLNVVSKPHYIWANLVTGGCSETWGWFKRLNNTKEAFKKLEKKDLENITFNLGKDIAVATSADMFYFPNRFRTEVMRLCPIFKNVFIEIAIPCILACLDSKTNWEKVSIWFDAKISYLRLKWPIDHTCIHPIKLSKAHNRELVRNIYQKFFSTFNGNYL